MRVETHKYKRLIANCFDVSEGSSVLGRFDKLSAYCSVNPRRLPSVCEDIEERLQKSIRKRKYNMRDAFIALDLMMHLIEKCGQYLGLMAAYLFRMISEAMGSGDLDMRCRATDAFVAFSLSPSHREKVHESYSLLHFFLDLCTDKTLGHPLLHRSQLTGLKAILRYIRMEGSIDQFYTDIVPVLLDIQKNSNPLAKAQPSGSADGLVEGVVYTPKGLSEKILSDIALNTTAEKLHSFLEAVFAYFDHNADWENNNLSELSLSMITSSVRQECEILVILHLIARLDLHRERPAARIGISKAIHRSLEKVESIHISSIIQTTDVLLRQLQLSMSHTTPAAAHQEKIFQDLIISNINRLCSLSSNPVDLDEVFFFVLDRISFMDQQSLVVSGVLSGFLQTASTILKQYPSYVRERQPSSHIYTVVCGIINTADAISRSSALSILKNLLNSTLRIIKLRPAQLNRDDFMFVISSLRAVFECAEKPSNLPEHYELISQIVLSVVEILHLRGVLLTFYSVTKIQTSAVQSGAMSVFQRNALHCLVTSYVWNVGRVIPLPVLVDYSRNVIEARRQKNQISKDIWVDEGTLRVNTYARTGAADTSFAPVGFAFDSAVLFRILIEQIPSLSSEVPQARSALEGSASENDMLDILIQRHVKSEIDTTVQNIIRNVSRNSLNAQKEANERTPTIRPFTSLEATAPTPKLSVEVGCPSYERILSSVSTYGQDRQKSASDLSAFISSLPRTSESSVATIPPSTQIFWRDTIFSDLLF